MDFTRQITGDRMQRDTIEEFMKLIKKSIELNKPLFIKSYMDYSFTWEHIIDAIDISYNTKIPLPKDVVVDDPDHLIDLQMAQPNKLKTSFDKPVTFHALDLLSANNKFDSKEYDEVKEMKEILQKTDIGRYVYDKFAINMAKNGYYVLPHRDSHHVLLTQVIGKSKYVIHESLESDPYSELIDVSERKFTEYDMEKNDILFMPKGTIHSIENSSPRVSCIFDIKDTV